MRNKKIISIALASIIATFFMAMPANAASRQIPVDDGVYMYTTLDVSSSRADASVSINVADSLVSVEMDGQYYQKGTTTIKRTLYGNGSLRSAASTSISNSNGTWVSITVTYKADYDGDTKKYVWNW